MIDSLSDFEEKETNVRQSSIILWSIIFLIVSFSIWVWTTKIDQVTRASGEVIPSENIRILQATEQSTIENLKVSEGQIVEANVLLLELDPTDVTSNINQLKDRRASLQIRKARLEAEASLAETFGDEQAGPALKIEMLIFQERRSALLTALAELDRKMAQKRNQVADLQSLLDAIELERDLINSELSDIQALVDQQLVSVDEVFRLRKDLNSVIRNRLQTQSSFEQIQSDIQGIEFQKQSERISYTRSALEDISKIDTDLLKINEQIPALEERSQKLQLRSPMKAVVNKVNVDGIGAVVQSGQDLIELVPLSAEPLIDAYVLPQDISSIYVGQDVIVKFSAYDFARYGGVDGEVVRIGSNAVPHPETKQSVFEVSVKTNTELLSLDGEPLPIIPGMTVELDMLGEKRRVADYFISSIVKVKDRALRE